MVYVHALGGCTSHWRMCGICTCPWRMYKPLEDVQYMYMPLEAVLLNEAVGMVFFIYTNHQF